MNGSKFVSGLGRSVQCETLETRQFFNVAGPLDTGFGGGIVTTSFGGTSEQAFEALPLKDGRVLAVGLTQSGTSESAAFAMYKANGTLDTSFDGDGKLVLPASAFPQQQGGDVVVTRIYQQPSGAILLQSNYGIFRMSLDGKLDATFGTGGKIDQPSVQILMNADGSFRTYTVPSSPSTGVEETSFDANGKKLSGSATNALGYSSYFLPNGNVIVVQPAARLTFYTADLKKITSLGNYGDTYLQSQFIQYVNNGRPWKDTQGNPIPASSVGIDFDTISTTRDGGYLIVGEASGTSAQYPFVDNGGYFTSPFTVKLDSKGNFVSLTPGDLANDGRTTVDFTPNYLQFDGNLAFGIGENVNIGDPNKAGGAATTEASNGAFYLAGFLESGDVQQFTIARTVPVVSSLSGVVFNDVDADGKQDNGENAEAGQTVFIDTNGNGKLDAGEYSTTTDASGKYTFSNIGPDTYEVRVVLAGAGTDTTTNAAVTVGIGENVTLNIGTHSTAVSKGSITGVLFNDNNRDATYDSGDTLNPGRTVYIDANHNGKLDAGEVSTTTDSNGRYVFGNLAAGTYDIKRVLPSGYSVTSSTTPVTLSAGQAATFNIGSNTTLAPSGNGTITGILFNDNNLDGTYDAGDTLNPGRTVYIDANHNGKLDPGEISTTTDSNGRYTFSDLAAGSYDIERVLPSSAYYITTSTAAVNLTAGQTVTFNIGSNDKQMTMVKDSIFA